MTASPPRSRGAVRTRPAALVAACALVATVLPGTALVVHAPPAEAAPSVARAATRPTATAPAASWSVRPTPSGAAGDRPNFSYDLAPGASLDDSIRVRNLGAVALTFRVAAADALTTRTGAIDLLPSGQRSRDAGAWVALSADTIVVAPGQFVDVPFRLAVPAGATAGDHAAGIVTSLTTDEADRGGGVVQVERRLGSRLMVRVGGPLEPAVRVHIAGATYRGSANPIGGGALTTTYTVRNTGNVRLRTDGQVRVEGPFGLSSTTADLARSPEILPGDTVTFVARVGGVRPTGPLDVSVRVRPVAARSGDRFDDPPMGEASTTVRAVPVALLVLVGAVAAIALAVWWNRARTRRRIDAAVATALSERDARDARAAKADGAPRTPGGSDASDVVDLTVEAPDGAPDRAASGAPGDPPTGTRAPTI